MKKIEIRFPLNKKEVVIVDNNTDQKTIRRSDFNVTTESVNMESNNSLSKKCDLIIKDLWTSSGWKNNTVEVDIYKNELLSTTFSIKIERKDKASNIWTLSSNTGNIMSLQPSVVGKIGDINLATLIFILKSEEIKFKNTSKDKDFIKSYKSFKQI